MNPLKRRLLTNLLMLSVVLGLVTLVLLEHREPMDGLAETLLPFGAEEIHSLRIQRPGQADVALQRQADGQWQLLKPVQLPAQEFRVQSLLRVAELRSAGGFKAPPDALPEYGLAPPRATLIINDKLHLEFGGNTALDHRRYLRIGDTIHTISDTLFFHLIGDAHGFVAHQLLPDDARITGLQLPDMHLKLEQGQWQISPVDALSSPDHVQTLLDAWRYPGIVQVRAWQGNEGVSIRITLEVPEQGPGQSLEFMLFEDGGEPALGRPDLGIQYRLSGASRDALLGRLVDLQ